MLAAQPHHRVNGGINMRELTIEFSENKQKHEYPENLGKRSKMGGVPDWIQENEIPVCPYCKNTMEFVCQIDSIDYGKKGNEKEFMFGDVGMLYNFFCFNCCKVDVVFQCY